MNKGLLLLILIWSAVTLQAQTLAKNDELKFDADYYLMEKEFVKAKNNYLTILKSEPDNADVKYRLGICYLNSEDEKEKSISYLEEAVQKISEKYNPSSFNETNAPVDALFLLGSAYRVNNELDKAVDSYTRYKEHLDTRDSYNMEVVDQYIRNCNLAVELQKNPVNMVSVNLGTPVNNEMPNFNGVISGDAKTLVYTVPGRQGYEIFSSTFADTAWTTPRNITSVLGTGKYMKTSDLSYDGQTLLLMLDDPMNADIFISHFSKGRWSKAEPLGKEINSKSNETHACLSADSKTLYFTSDRKGGEGDMDIYRSDLDPKGEWGKPTNLGNAINTRFNEETPFITDDGQKLYFSSEGHNGIGGYDVFYYDFGNTSAGAVNVGYPLNTTDNDLFFAPWGDGSSAYYSYKGSDTYGGRDIYLVRVEKKETVVEETEVAEEAPVAEASPAVETVEAIAETVVAEPIAPVVEYVTAEAVEEPIVVEEPFIIEKSVPVYNPPSSSPARSYKVQIMALRKPVDLMHFPALQGIAVAYGSDHWYRYTLGSAAGKPEAEKLLGELTRNGYRDAFIRSENVVPRFTIQVMAVPGPVIDLTRFDDLPEISVTRGTDHFCRYTTGTYETREDALANLERIQKLGYKRAFVSKIKMQQ